MLGTSLTGSGLDSMNVLENGITRRTGKPVRVLKLWKLDAAPSTFTDLSPALLRLRPSLVVIEANMLFYFFEKKKGWPAYTQRFRDFVNRKKEEYLPDAKPFVLRRQIKELEGFRSGLHDTTHFAGLRQLLAAWQEQGAVVSLLNFPLESALESRKWNSSDTSAFHNNLRYLRRACNITFNNAKEPLDESFFTDHAHMNVRGQQKQSSHFSALAAQQLGTQ